MTVAWSNEKPCSRRSSSSAGKAIAGTSTRKSTTCVVLGRPRIEIASPPMRAWRIDLRAKASESNSTARINSSELWPASISMAREELPDGTSLELGLFDRILAGPGCLRRPSHDERAGIQQAPNHLEPVLRRKRPKPRHVLENHLCLTGELDGQVHSKLRNLKVLATGIIATILRNPMRTRDPQHRRDPIPARPPEGHHGEDPELYGSLGLIPDRASSVPQQ